MDPIIVESKAIHILNLMPASNMHVCTTSSGVFLPYFAGNGIQFSMITLNSPDCLHSVLNWTNTQIPLSSISRILSDPITWICPPKKMGTAMKILSKIKIWTFLHWKSHRGPNLRLQVRARWNFLYYWSGRHNFRFGSTFKAQHHFRHVSCQELQMDIRNCKSFKQL